MKHTFTHLAGPWNALTIASPLGASCRIYAEDGNKDIAHIHREWHGDGGGARLIKAAPKLLDIAMAISDWEAKYPASRIYGESQIRTIAREMTEIVEAARKVMAEVAA